MPYFGILDLCNRQTQSVTTAHYETLKQVKDAKTAKTAKCPTLAVLTGATERYSVSQRVTTGHIPGQDRQLPGQDRQVAQGTPLTL